MTPALHQEFEPDSPIDLARLRILYQGLPHRTVRWQTRPGVAFLNILFDAIDRHDIRTVADALGVTTQGVEQMINRKRVGEPRPWPSQDDLRRLRAAWRVVHRDVEAGRSINRQDHRYARMHRALKDLLDDGFAFRDLCLALGVPARRLRRFEQPPLTNRAPGRNQP